MMKSYSFVSLSELDIPVRVRIGTLTGDLDHIPFSVFSDHPELRFRGSNISLSDLYVTVQLWADSKPLTLPVQTPYKYLADKRSWNEILTLPVSYPSLPRSAQLAITVWDLLPSEKATSDHRIPFGGTTVPLFNEDGVFNQGRQRCKLHLNEQADGMTNPSTPFHIPSDDQTHDKRDELETLMKKHETGEIPENHWLDRLTFRQLEYIEEKNKTEPTGIQSSDPYKLSGDMFLYIELARFQQPVVFTDRQYPPPAALVKLSNMAGNHRNAVRTGDVLSKRLLTVFDPEIGADNPSESAHRVLVRSGRAGVPEVDIRLSVRIRNELNSIMAYGPTKTLTSEEKDLVWKYRHPLTNDKRGLTKFVKSVSWNDAKEVRLAVQLLPRWVSIDLEDALELLGPTFKHPAVRAFAVDRLRSADDDKILLYLLQLVQALKYEPAEHSRSASSLSRFLIERAVKSLALGTALHWYLTVECDDSSEHQREEHRRLFARVEFDFMEQLSKEPDGPSRKRTLLRQGELVAVLTTLSHQVKAIRENQSRIKYLRDFLSNPANKLLEIDPPLPLPLDPSVSVVGCSPAQSTVFKSSMRPIQLTFITTTGELYPLLFKTGDDLRQDQLVIQIIMLMEGLLKTENLDLCLSPYRILATGATAGMVQFVPSAPISALGNDILTHLKAARPNSDTDLGVDKDVMDTYIKSCAGYSVITYILGIGDRHLDNILLAPDGHFLHADFGYILGRDPKPFAPSIKLTSELVDGMGGVDHLYFQQFKEHCFTAYTALRKSSSLILNLFALMTDANIPDIRIEPDKAVFKVLDRFRLDLSEERAIRFFDQLITDSLRAVMPVMFDRIHALVQNWIA